MDTDAPGLGEGGVQIAQEGAHPRQRRAGLVALAFQFADAGRDRVASDHGVDRCRCNWIVVTHRLPLPVVRREQRPRVVTSLGEPLLPQVVGPVGDN